MIVRRNLVADEAAAAAEAVRRTKEVYPSSILVYFTLYCRKPSSPAAAEAVRRTKEVYSSAILVYFTLYCRKPSYITEPPRLCAAPKRYIPVESSDVSR